MENNLNKNIEQALDLYKKEDYRKASDAFLKLLEQDKNNPNILNNIGLCFMRLSQDDKAAEYFIKALSYNPKAVQTYINLADVYFRNKKMIDGINLLENAVTLMPKEIALKHYLARFCLQDCRYDEALIQLLEILDIDEENLDAYWDLGNVQFKLGDYASASANYEHVLEKITNNSVMYYQAAAAYEASDDIDKAVSNHLKAISCNENFEPSYKKLGMLFIARRDYESAIEYFEDYLKFDIPDEERENIKELISRLKTINN